MSREDYRSETIDFSFLRAWSSEILSAWCQCICREAPDGTKCELCGHAHEDSQ